MATFAPNLKTAAEVLLTAEEVSVKLCAFAETIRSNFQTSSLENTLWRAGNWS